MILIPAKQMPSPRQRDVLRFVCRVLREQGVAPTLQEIGDEVGCAKTTAYEHVYALRVKGLLQRGKEQVHLARNAMPTQLGCEYVDGLRDEGKP